VERYDVVVVGGGSPARAASSTWPSAASPERCCSSDRTSPRARPGARRVRRDAVHDPDRVRWNAGDGAAAGAARSLGTRCPSCSTGSSSFARSPGALRRFARTARAARGRRGARDRTGGGRSLAPALPVDDLAGAVFGPLDGWVDPPRLCGVLVGLACARGAEARRAEVTCGARGGRAGRGRRDVGRDRRGFPWS
jgi:glycine/D-amino acid oxidase-like deaminating enzyme